MNMLNTPMKCCRCRNQHTAAERVDVPSKKWADTTESTCPKCGARSFYDMTPQVAWCWASGLIEFGNELPNADAIEIARGPHYAIRGQVGVHARHGYGDNKGKLLVPGVPEAANQLAGLEALDRWLKQINRRKPRDGVIFSKEVK